METTITSTDRNVRSTNRPRPRPVAVQPRAGQDTRFRRQRHLLALFVVTLGVMSACAHLTWRWYQGYARVQQVNGTLQAVWSRQNQFYQTHQAYTGVIGDLKMNLDPTTQGQIQLVAGWIQGRPSFVAEYCSDGHCGLIDASGALHTRLELVPGTRGGTLPLLKEGSGQQSPTRRSR